MASPKAFVKRRKARKITNRYVSAFINVFFICSVMFIASKLLEPLGKEPEKHYNHNKSYYYNVR